MAIHTQVMAAVTHAPSSTLTLATIMDMASMTPARFVETVKGPSKGRNIAMTAIL